MGLFNELNSQFGGDVFVGVNTQRIHNDFIEDPAAYGFATATQACCGQGRFNGMGLCTMVSHLCNDRDAYGFWDAFHPTERANRLIQEAPVIDDSPPAAVGDPPSHPCHNPTHDEETALSVKAGWGVRSAGTASLCALGLAIKWYLERKAAAPQGGGANNQPPPPPSMVVVIPPAPAVVTPPSLTLHKSSGV
ncbi:hypothetical protein PR202_ga03036 [Eleusine coracana subsp. coracana]|uniref:GDSL esterase/lipase n=1 Tax=Eleusine coracana subsp. coracana TaxID=191504 RepID=A0AAV5BMI0_ELECO|nr:hypothetical protein PR202_ga03036 [Eleusine coracana subsp. coracana]